MAAPYRRPRAPIRSAPSRAASVFFVLGCLTVLVVTFALGVAAGRRWPSGLPGFEGASPGARAERESVRRAEARGLDTDRTKPRTETPPVMTFYQDLRAPMTPPPPPRVPAKPERSDARAGEAVRPGPRPTDARHDTAIRDIERIPASLAPALEPRFTVQVGAFKVRTQADALRARLAESGQDAYVDEGEVGGVPQYRVRVGTFITREAARDAAARLTAERHLATYVTTR